MIMGFNKNMLWLGICGLVFFCSIRSIHAELYNREYESQSGIGFYGEYIFPEEPSEPIEVPVVKEIKRENPSVNEKIVNKSFPQTGVMNTELFLPGILLVIGSCMLVKKGKRGDI